MLFADVSSWLDLCPYISKLCGEQVSGSRRKSTVLVSDEIVIVSIETAVRRELE